MAIVSGGIIAYRGMAPEAGVRVEIEDSVSARFPSVTWRCSMAAVVDPEKCTGCETCVDSCPLDAISMKDDLAVIDADTCGDCGACVDVCPVEAISL
jgi:NAD-dependent dihydropyrimidine dehydrogenase PreA subunit